MRRLIVAATFLIVPGLAHAQFFSGTIAGGLGGAGRAAVDPAGSAYLNPASVAHLQRYYFGADYQLGELSSEADFSRYALQLSDGTSTNLVPGAFSFVQNTIDLSSSATLKQDDYQISIGGFALPKLAVGVSVHHLIQKGNVGAGFSQVSERQTGATLGLLYTPIETLGLGLVGYDLFATDSDVTGIQELNPVYALAANILLLDVFSARLDLVRPTIGARDRTDVMAGIESFFRPDFAVRLGTQWRETAGETNMTAGLGYKGPRLSLDYSVQKDLRSEGSIRHLIDLWLPL